GGGEGGGGVDHRLLVAGLVVGQRAGSLDLGLQQGLADAGDVAVAEDAEAAGEQLVLHAVPFAALRGEEADQRLGDGEPYRVRGHHIVLPCSKAGPGAAERTRPTAVSTAASTSSSGGYSRARPTTRPRTPGRSSARCQVV